jgi:hypothetical protein
MNTASLMVGKENAMKALKICFAGLVLLLFLASCNLRPGAGLNQTPLPDTLTPTITGVPSITPIPLSTRRATFVPIITATRAPSFTPLPSNTPIPAAILEAIQAQVTKARFLTGNGSPYQCKLVSVEPSELEVMRPKEEFSGNWRFLNVGKAQWSPSDIAYFYISGSKFQTPKYREDFIPYFVNPKEILRLRVPMRAPAEPGVYFTIWGLRIKSAKQFFCTFSISITVQEKK